MSNGEHHDLNGTVCYGGCGTLLYGTRQACGPDGQCSLQTAMEDCAPPKVVLLRDHPECEEGAKEVYASNPDDLMRCLTKQNRPSSQQSSVFVEVSHEDPNKNKASCCDTPVQRHSGVRRGLKRFFARSYTQYRKRQQLHKAFKDLDGECKRS